MNLQHISIKIFASEARINISDAIAVFHGWIQRKACPEMPIDVADYRHVPNGPGVILVCHEAIYGLDQREGRLGLLYNRRTALEGSNLEKLDQAYGAAWAACRLLQDEPTFRGKLIFDPGDFEVLVNDRLLAPNTDETLASVRPEVEQLLTKVFGSGKYNFDRVGEPRQLFRLAVRAHAA